MFAIAFDDALARRHAPLVEMAAAIAGAQASETSVALRDLSDSSPPPPGARVVTLSRDRLPMIRRDSATRLSLC